MARSGVLAFGRRICRCGRHDSFAMSDEDTVEVGDAAKKVFNARAGLKQLLSLLESGFDVGDLGDDRGTIDALVKKLEEFVSSGGEAAGVGVEGVGRVIGGPRDEEIMSVASSRWSTEAINDKRKPQQGSQQGGGGWSSGLANNSFTSNSKNKALSDTASDDSTIPEVRGNIDNSIDKTEKENREEKEREREREVEREVESQR